MPVAFAGTGATRTRRTEEISCSSTATCPSCGASSNHDRHPRVSTSGWRRRATARRGDRAPETWRRSPATPLDKTLEAIPRAERAVQQKLGCIDRASVRQSEQWLRTEERPMCTWSPSPPLAAHRARARSTCRADWRGQLVPPQLASGVAVADGPGLRVRRASLAPRGPRGHGQGVVRRPWLHQREERLERRAAWMFSMPMKAICVFG